jgi:hypothetical protein
MTWRTHIVFWICVWGMVLLASPLMLPMEGQIARIKKEIELTRGAFGDAQVAEIIQDASSTYKAIFIETGYLTSNSKVYTKPMTAEQKQLTILEKTTEKFATVTNGYLTALSVNLYGVMVRWGIFCHWLLFIAPFLVAAFIDGFVVRKIKFSEFGFISPMAYSFSLHGIIFILFIPLLYLIAPLPITPYFMPGWALVLSFPIMLMIANTQRLLNA